MPYDRLSRRAGVLCPVFAVRHEADLGIGDVEGVRQLVDWAADHDLAFVQLLPINATGGDPSPYNAISSIALDPLTLDLRPESVPDLTAKDVDAICARHDLAALRAGRVSYPAVRSLKLELLRAAYRQFRRQRHRRAAFEAWREGEGDWLDDFARFRVLIDAANGSDDWTAWPADRNTPARARAWLVDQGRAVHEALEFHAYVQWLASMQWTALRDHARSRGVRLMGDIPFGVSYGSADVFFRPEQFDLEWCGGAPPEPYFKDDPFTCRWGQNWGIPLYRWDTMAADGHAWWRRRIAKTVEIFDLFRIDHVLGFYRIYRFPWRPQRNAEFLPLSADEAARRTGGRLPHYWEHADDAPEHLAANLRAGDARLRIVLEAAGSAEVVAEDLGAVPQYVRPHLRLLDVPGFKIPQWESGPRGEPLAAFAYPPCSFVTIATHDHEPMRTLWNRLRGNLQGGDEGARWAARQELSRLSAFAGLDANPDALPAYDDGVRRRLLEAMLASPSRFAAFQITDLLGLEDRFNVPGIAGDRNWSARLPFTVRELTRKSPWREEGEWLAGAVKRTGRAG